MVPGDAMSSDVGALLAELAALRGELVAMKHEQDADLARLRTELADDDEERARQARAGAFGREWQLLQRRVDAGQTTTDAILRGEDDSPQAEVVRGYARQNAEAVARELDEAAAAAERGVTPVDAGTEAMLSARTAAAEVHERVAALRLIPPPLP